MRRNNSFLSWQILSLFIERWQWQIRYAQKCTLMGTRMRDVHSQVKVRERFSGAWWIFKAGRKKHQRTQLNSQKRSFPRAFFTFFRWGGTNLSSQVTFASSYFAQWRRRPSLVFLFCVSLSRAYTRHNSRPREARAVGIKFFSQTTPWITRISNFNQIINRGAAAHNFSFQQT